MWEKRKLDQIWAIHSISQQTSQLSGSGFHCYNAHTLSEVVQCFCLNHTEGSQKLQAKLTQILLAAYSGPFTNDFVFSHESSFPPPSLTLKDSLHCGKNDNILDSIAPADLAHAVRTATVLDCDVLNSNISFWKCFDYFTGLLKRDSGAWRRVTF